MKKIAYLRVSTQEQRPDRQVEGLKGLADELHIETLSATSRCRPIYSEIVGRLEPGDLLVVWDLDRAYRSVVDALTEAEKLRQRGVGLWIVSLAIDLSTPAGHFIYTMMGALAEFERRTLSQRTKEGLAAARQRGQRLGRPTKLTDQQLRHARHQLDTKAGTVRELAEAFNVVPWTLSRCLKRWERQDANSGRLAGRALPTYRQ